MKLGSSFPHRRLEQALSTDEEGDRMKALELYNGVLAYISRVVTNESGEDGSITKLEK